MTFLGPTLKYIESDRYVHLQSSLLSSIGDNESMGNTQNEIFMAYEKSNGLYFF